MMDEKTFTQEELNEIIGERLARERKKFEAERDEIEESIRSELRANELAEQNNYKELYEQANVEQMKGRVEKFNKYVEQVLAKTVENLGERAEKAISHFDDPLDKLSWLEENKELFKPQGDGVGTPSESKERKTGKQEYNFRFPTL